MTIFETSPLVLLAVAILAFILGSVPFGLIVAKAMGLPDPRSIGSKNIGATNVLRTGSKGAALATLLLDAAKGLIAVVVARALTGEDGALAAAFFAFLGHCYSAFLSFKGGKGVATYLGALFGLAFMLGAIACVFWLATFVLTRYSSLSALMAAAMMPLVALLGGGWNTFLVILAMSALLAWRHRENISRLRAGTEARVGSNSG
ncbi:MAG: glycerol-3-phosphate 1-O-acyltransferase PlsY [Paracoccaceae bacterium]|nr:glycerol-3-phosphate 1-O-acyltransferase PlsY [Paracoccaceae bacterium]